MREVMEFFAPVFQNVKLLDHPPRVKMFSEERSFTARSGWWVVNPTRGAYYPLRNDDFQRLYELVAD